MTTEVAVALGLGLVTALQTVGMFIAGNARRDRVTRDSIINGKLDSITETVGKIQIDQATYIERTNGHSGQLRALWDRLERRGEPRHRPDDDES